MYNVNMCYANHQILLDRGKCVVIDECVVMQHTIASTEATPGPLQKKPGFA